MTCFVPKEDATHNRAVGVFCMEKRADGSLHDVPWRFCDATFDGDGRVDQKTRALLEGMVFAVGRAAHLPGILWTDTDLDPLRFAVRMDKADAIRALDPGGIEIIPMGPLWDRKGRAFLDAPSYALVNVLRRVDGWDASAMTLSPFPVRGNPDDVLWSRTTPGYLNPAAVGDVPLYQDQKTRELIINDAARAVFESCDAPALYYAALKFA